MQQICSQLAGAIEDEAPEAELERLVEEGVRGVLAQTDGAPPHRAILGCTHFPLVEHLFRRHLPPFTRILSQPEVVADSLEDYLARRPHYLDGDRGHGLTLLTTGEPALISATGARVLAGGRRASSWRPRDLGQGSINARAALISRAPAVEDPDHGR